ncbi:MAG: DJ-1/PfpI family protein, partial [Cyclobacteriaceae bacterium]
PLVMSICSGARILARLGFLDNKPYCTHQGVYNHMSELVPSGKPQYDKRFVQSGDGLYTSGGISAGIDLSFHIVEKLHGEGVAKTTAKYMEYKGFKN